MLSILIPCYNEEINIFKNTDKLIGWANSKSYKVEINLINNASMKIRRVKAMLLKLVY